MEKGERSLQEDGWGEEASQLTSTSTPRGLSDPAFPKSQEAVADVPNDEDGSALFASGLMPSRPAAYQRPQIRQCYRAQLELS